MEKDKKKTLTISSNLKKKIDTPLLHQVVKKSFSIEKKNNFNLNKPFNRSGFSKNLS